MRLMELYKDIFDMIFNSQKKKPKPPRKKIIVLTTFLSLTCVVFVAYIQYKNQDKTPYVQNESTYSLSNTNKAENNNTNTNNINIFPQGNFEEKQIRENDVVPAQLQQKLLKKKIKIADPIPITLENTSQDTNRRHSVQKIYRFDNVCIKGTVTLNSNGSEVPSIRIALGDDTSSVYLETGIYMVNLDSKIKGPSPQDMAVRLLDDNKELEIISGQPHSFVFYKIDCKTADSCKETFLVLDINGTHIVARSVGCIERDAITTPYNIIFQGEKAHWEEEIAFNNLFFSEIPPDEIDRLLELISAKIQEKKNSLIQSK